MKKGGPGRLFTPFVITQMVLAAAVGSALWLAYLPWRWERTKDDLRSRFPSVRRIDADGLKGWFAKNEEPKPVLIDVRPQADFDFSHLPHALHMAVSDTPAPLGYSEKTDASLVLYDAVGEDAFPVAESLVKRGYARVQVLEGGIFEWANRGLPLEGPSGATGKVQPGKSKFSRLLKRSATAP
jgi:rhodanese-related sulfurtransferase